MAENIYKQARLRAAEKKKELKSAEKACGQLYISREKLLKIEQDDPKKQQTQPNPEEVKRMAEVYDAPELCDHYCSNQCPIGSGKRTLIHENLGEISARLMAALHSLESINDSIHKILGDSQVSEAEKHKFSENLQVLKEVAYSAQCLELWAQKNGLIPGKGENGGL